MQLQQFKFIHAISCSDGAEKKTGCKGKISSPRNLVVQVQRLSLDDMHHICSRFQVLFSKPIFVDFKDFCFYFFKCVVWFSVQLNFSDFFRSGLSGWRNIAKYGINLRWWTELRKDLKFFRVAGGVIFIITLVFEANGLIPLFVNFKPSYSRFLNNEITADFFSDSIIQFF